MTGQRWSSPFGARPISAASVAAEVRLRARQTGAAARRDETGDSPGDGRVADKWQLLRALSEAAGRFGLSDRTVCVLEALLSFQAGREIDGRAPVIVFPSNRELSLRSRGMAPATLRRHLALLVEAGMIVRRDSPNGKRFRRHAVDGEGHGEAFGFDVSPLAWRHAEILAVAETARRETRQAARLRSALSIHRRDLRKVLELAMREGRPGDWLGFAERLVDLSRLPVARTGGIAELERAETEIVRLRAEIETRYLETLSEAEMSANDAESERHYQNTKTESFLESDRLEKEEEAASTAPDGPAAAEEEGRGAATGGEARAPAGADKSRRGDGEFDLGSVLRLCPDIVDYAREPVRSWADLRRAADLVRGFLGISSPFYGEVRAAMGDTQAAVVVAVLLQQADRIRSPGAYLRNLAHRASQGRFRVEPMLRALEKAT